MLKKKEYRFGDGDYIEIEIYQDGRYGAPGKKREPKKKPTPEQIQKQNQKNKEIRIRRYLRANFKKNDYWITGTYKKENRPGIHGGSEKASGEVQEEAAGQIPESRSRT